MAAREGNGAACTPHEARMSFTIKEAFGRIVLDEALLHTLVQSVARHILFEALVVVLVKDL